MKGFGGGMPGNMQALMKQAQKMQQQIQEAQANGEKLTAEFQSGGGVVKAVANGKNELLSLLIDPSIIDPSDKEVLEKMILSTVNGALSAAREKVQAEIAKATGEMSIPGLI